MCVSSPRVLSTRNLQKFSAIPAVTEGRRRINQQLLMEKGGAPDGKDQLPGGNRDLLRHWLSLIPCHFVLNADDDSARTQAKQSWLRTPRCPGTRTPFFRRTWLSGNSSFLGPGAARRPRRARLVRPEAGAHGLHGRGCGDGPSCSEGRPSAAVSTRRWVPGASAQVYHEVSRQPRVRVCPLTAECEGRRGSRTLDTEARPAPGTHPPPRTEP